VSEKADLVTTVPHPSQQAETEASAPPESEQLSREPTEPPQAQPSEAQAPPESPQTIPNAAEAPLTSWQDLLPIAQATLPPHTVELPTAPHPTEAEEHDAELFHGIASEHGPLRDAMRVVIPRQTRLLSRRGRALVYLLVLLAALMPVFTDDQTSSLVQPRGSVTALAQTIQNLPPDSAVLISLDYGPAYAGEMDALALAVARHLVARPVRTVLMSTNPSGIGLIEHLCRTITNQTPDYHYGERYAILGYLPSAEAGLRTLWTSLGNAFKADYVQHRSLSELPVMKGLLSLQDFDQVIVLADDGRSVQTWIEQVQSQGDIRLHALVTAAIQPMLVPYEQSGQLSTLIAGAPSATEYEKASGMQSPARHWTDAYAAFCVLLLLVAVATNVTYLRDKRRARRP